MDLKTFCKRIPKIELHAHLNGSVSLKTLLKLSELQSPADAKSQIIHEIHPSESLKECFKLFEIVHSLTDTPETIFIATSDVIQEFYDDNVIYLELRSTPRHVEGKMTKREYIEAIINAIKSPKIKKTGITVKLLISVDRKRGAKNAEENIALAIEYYEKYSEYVVGIDLSGDPIQGEISIDLLQRARNVGLKIAAHCAEVPNEKEVVDILNFKPDRLGHCTCIHPNLNGTKQLYDMLLKSRIPVELCLTSNVKCKTVPSFSEHQFAYLYEAKHPICIATDDKGVFGTTLSAEFELVAIHFGLTRQNLKDLCLSAVQFAFATEKEKSQLSLKIELFYNIN
ncbi:hypothetical protein PV327_008282 [Microctonus hyperodae]|uniref:Adenosine deaminase-like protein n=1 Tax=Microctonus hyperodae TaxID=165561 RepID=A0AA39F2T4_MICHY|nr:hypothetical protein PV327_008282 [Microctonus hyperodae]